MTRALVLSLLSLATALPALAGDLPVRPVVPNLATEVAAPAASQTGAAAPAIVAQEPGAATQPAPAPEATLPISTKDYSAIPAWLRYSFGPDNRLQTSPYSPDLSLGVGGWGVFYRGNKVKIGEWQDVFSSPFWDVDGLRTNGTRTIDFHATGTDNETSSVGARFYGPRGRVNVDFERFIHRRDHKPLDNFIAPIVRQDLNVGDEYAVRVDELKTSIDGKLTDHIKLRVDVFDMHRFGERQANAVAHCFVTTGSTARPCHVLSQRQVIDWNTTQITPRVEGIWGPLTIEYLRPMTMFSQNDQQVTRSYRTTSTALLGGVAPFNTTPLPYGIVPNNTTQIDQLRVGLDVTPRTRFYSYGYWGHTDDFARNIDRDFGGADWRLTNTSIDGNKLDAYGRLYYQTGIRPSSLLLEETVGFNPPAAAAAIGNSRISSPLGFLRSTVGVSDRWLPRLENEWFQHLALTAGYEYDYLGRRNASYDQAQGRFTFNQGNTITHSLRLGVQQPWTRDFGTYARYKVQFVTNPLLGFRADSGELNSNRPQQQHIIEFGQNWTPNDRFAVFTDAQVDVGWHATNSPFLSTNLIRFSEQSYSMQASTWYAVTEKLSLTAGGSFNNNWINQNIILGTDYVEPGLPPGNLITPVTRLWDYGGTSSAVNVRATYMVNGNVRLSGGYEYVCGVNQFTNNGFADLWPDLNQYSRVIVITQRVFAGVDWSPRDRLNVYFRYNFFDYQDRTAAYNTGTLHAFLLGGSMFF